MTRTELSKIATADNDGIKAVEIDALRGTHPQHGEMAARIVDYTAYGMGIRFEFTAKGGTVERQVTLEKAKELMAQFRGQVGQ